LESRGSVADGLPAGALEHAVRQLMPRRIARTENKAFSDGSFARQKEGVISSSDAKTRRISAGKWPTGEN
jgi:hypothetical protein